MQARLNGLRTGMAVLFLVAAGCSSSSSSSGSTSTGGSGSSGGSGSGGTSGGVACGYAPGELTPGNNTRETATPYTLGSPVKGCLTSSTQNDFFQFTSPADNTGGGVAIALGPVGDGAIQFQVFDGADNSLIYSLYTGTAGASLNGSFAAAPGHVYRIQVSSFSSGSAPYRYRLTATYTQVNDTFEPNDTFETAKPITVGTPIQAYLFAGFNGAGNSIPAVAYDDWYSVTLAAGNFTATISNVPTDVDAQVDLVDASKAVLASVYGSNAGQGFVVPAATGTPVTVTAGTYRVRVTTFSMGPGHADGTTPPDSFTHPYTLVVNQ
jgi:hypothetical protein